MPERSLRVHGTVRVPGDKSVSHRALMLASLAQGPSRVRGILRGEDVQSTARVLRALGANIPSLGPDILIDGRGRRGLRSAREPLDCGNSGTTARLMAGILAGTGCDAVLIGDASLSQRPMGRVATPLRAMGARITFLEQPDRLPMRVEGAPLHSIAFESPTASAQVKSAVLLAAVAAGITASVTEPARSRDHTERMLRSMGVDLFEAGTTVTVRSVPAELAPLDCEVPGDPSSAAYFMALGALATHGSIALQRVLLNSTRTGLLAALRRMGANITVRETRIQSGEDVGDIVTTPVAELVATTVSPDEVPSMIDELPLLACVAARARGETVIRGASEMRVKESDRIAVTVKNLRRIGVDATELPDGIVVRGGSDPLRGSIETHDDHRMAMAFGVLAALPDSAISIDNPACVGISYPDFWDHLTQVTSGPE